MPFVSHQNTNPQLHLNSHDLHLNINGSACLAQNFGEHLVRTAELG